MHVYISNYDQLDHPTGARFISHLKALGCTISSSPPSTEAGEAPYGEGAEGADAFVAFLSPSYDAGWTLAEWAQALEFAERDGLPKTFILPLEAGDLPDAFDRVVAAAERLPRDPLCAAETLYRRCQ